MVTEREVKEALQTIVDNKDEKALNWAVNYAATGIQMTGTELYVQALYVIGNITHWRGEEAKKVREVLKDFIGQKEI